jgi:hypothetical protein
MMSERDEAMMRKHAEGHTLSGDFMEFARECIAEEASSMQRRDMRLAYFEGSSAMFNALMSILNSEESDEVRLRRIDRYRLEIALVRRMQRVEMMLHSTFFRF